MNIRNDRIDDSRIPASFERPTDDKAKSYVKQTKLGNDYVWKVGLEKSGTFSGPWQKIKHTLQDLFCRGKVVHIPLKDLGSDSRIELNNASFG